MATPLEALQHDVGQANSRFRKIYREEQNHESHQVPVLVVLADKLVLARRRGRVEYPLVSDAISTIKSVAHLPVGLVVAAAALKGGGVDGQTRPAFVQLDADVKRIEEALADSGSEANEPHRVAPLHDVLATTRTLLDHLLAGGAADTTTLDAFGARLRDPLQACITAASRLQLELLHRRVGSLVRDLDPWERRALQVVVLGDHQARRRSLPMQYFEKLLAEPSGTEVRLAYGEGISTVEEAIALVGAKRLDVVIAGLVFGDPLRLYRDVLGDAAADALQSLDISPLT